MRITYQLPSLLFYDTNMYLTLDTKKSAQTWQWILLIMAVVLSSISLRPPIPIDETRYLSVAWEMWQSNEFLVPHINGQPYSHKPPMLFWLIQLSWLLFGVNEWSARLVSPLFGFGSIIVTLLLARKLWPTERDLHMATPFIVLGTLVWTVFSSLTMFDTLLTFFSLLALYSVFSASTKKSILPWFGLSLAIGMGILAKGPIILLHTLPAILLAPWWVKNRSLSWSLWYSCSLAAIAAGIGLALCWAIPAAAAGGEEYRQAILFSQTAGRVVQAFAHARPFYWYILLLPFILFPWIFCLPETCWSKLTVSDKSTRFCLCAAGGSFILLSLVSGKQIHYVIPVIPLLALLIARIIFPSPQIGKYAHLPLVLIYVLLSLFLFIVPSLDLYGRESEILTLLPRWIVAGPLFCGLFLHFFRQSSPLGYLKTVSCSIVALMLLFNLAARDPMQAIYDQSDVGSKIHSIQQQGMQVAVYPGDLADQFQFAGRLTQPLIPVIIDSGKMTPVSIDDTSLYFLIHTKNPEYNQIIVSSNAQRYNNGWLIWRPAEDAIADEKD
jgi:4-amino-4-deoxy-L-arabinose transferase-like glycosyltransferase